MAPEINIAKLDAAWGEVEKAIGNLGALIRGNPQNKEALQRYEAYKAALASIAESYVNQIHYDRDRPESLPSFGSLFNFGGPAPDFQYHLIHIAPGSSYRVWGRRGDAAIIDVQQLAGWFGQDKAVSLANELFDEKNTGKDDEGNFDFCLSSSKQGEAWWKLDERTSTVFIREYFTDYTTQGRSSVFHFDKLGEDKGETAADINVAINKINAFAQSLKAYEVFFSVPETFAKVGDNRFQEVYFGDASMSNQRYFQARFKIKPTQALVGKWAVPKSYLYWSIALYNDAYQMLNYGNRQVNLNHALATTGADGNCYFVLSQSDPGIANWMDLDGHEQGIVLMRTKGASAFELPDFQLVDIDDVSSCLPKDIERVSDDKRRQDLLARRRHFQMREQR